MVLYRCTHCPLVARMSALSWMAHRLDNFATHRGPARHSNVPPMTMGR